jgi:hypothetical protein
LSFFGLNQKRTKKIQGQPDGSARLSAHATPGGTLLCSVVAHRGLIIDSHDHLLINCCTAPAPSEKYPMDFSDTDSIGTGAAEVLRCMLLRYRMFAMQWLCTLFPSLFLSGKSAIAMQ